MGMILDSHGLSKQETTETFTMEPGPFPRKEVLPSLNLSCMPASYSWHHNLILCFMGTCKHPLTHLALLSTFRACCLQLPSKYCLPGLMTHHLVIKDDPFLYFELPNDQTAYFHILTLI